MERSEEKNARKVLVSIIKITPRGVFTNNGEFTHCLLSDKIIIELPNGKIVDLDVLLPQG
jgi:hypothetical protein